MKTEELPYKPLYFLPGSKLLEPDRICSGLIGAISAFSCLIWVIIFQVELKFVDSGYFKVFFQNLEPKSKWYKNIISVTTHTKELYCIFQPSGIFYLESFSRLNHGGSYNRH